MSAQHFHPTRGELIDIGGRRLRLVRAGERSAAPVILCESGAFGFAADWAVVQEKLAARGLYSLAYDRAGLGYSDSGPWPRDGHAILADLEALLKAAGESGPYLLVGHSMAGLFVRMFAARNPGDVVGAVLVDATTAETVETPLARNLIRQFGRVARVWSVGAGLGLTRPLAPLMGDSIGLTGEAGHEKRRIFATAGHHRQAAEEVRCWPETSLQAREGGSYDPALPIAVITAGPEEGLPALKAMQSAPARASRAGYVEHVDGANHANLLGEAFADPVVRGVDHVLKARG